MKPEKNIDKENQEKSIDYLANAFSLIENAEEARLFLEDLCTPAELQAMADRWRVVEPIKQGIPYRKIYEETGVSVTTVGRIARFISQGTGGYNLIFERMQKVKHGKK